MRGKLEQIQDQRITLQRFQHEYLEAYAYHGTKGQYCSERVQGKKSIYYSSIDAAHEAIQDLNQDILLLLKAQIDIWRRISRNEKEMLPVEQAINYLSKADREICEYKYKYKMSFDEIAKAVSMSKSGVRHRRRKIVAFIYKYLIEMI